MKVGDSVKLNISWWGDCGNLTISLIFSSGYFKYQVQNTKGNKEVFTEREVTKK